MIGQCPVCHAYLLRAQMLVRGDHGWRVLVCSTACGARIAPVRPHMVGDVEQLDAWQTRPDADVGIA